MIFFKFCAKINLFWIPSIKAEIIIKEKQRKAKTKTKEMKKTQIEEMLNRKENSRCNELHLVQKKLGWNINTTR
jgi:hypothetical protein